MCHEVPRHQPSSLLPHTWILEKESKRVLIPYDCNIRNISVSQLQIISTLFCKIYVGLQCLKCENFIQIHTFAFITNKVTVTKMNLIAEEVPWINNIYHFVYHYQFYLHSTFSLACPIYPAITHS